MQDIHDLATLLKARTPIILIESREEQRVIDLMAHVAGKLRLPLYAWNVAEGMRRVGSGNEHTSNREPVEMLQHIWSLRMEGVYLLLDFHPYLDDPTHVRIIKEISQQAEKYHQTLIFVSHELKLPPELSHFAARFEVSLPDEKTITRIVAQVAERWSQEQPGQRVRADREAMQGLVKNLQGLSAMEAARLARLAIYDDGAITKADAPTIAKAKYDVLNQDGVLSFEHDTAHLSEVGGLTRFKAWLRQREAVFKNTGAQQGLEPPKGLLLLGVQGGGKSLAAKAVAGTWGVPLLRLDFGALYDKYFGETERRTREALKMAETMQPCVLWIDEIEKGVATGEGENGTTRRVLGTMLTWMAERKASVFIVATANDIKALPPELMRKGRLDEVFFVDLPDAATRRAIFSIHFTKRNLDPAAFDLDALTKASEGFSGSEIEQAIVSGLYAITHGSGTLDTALLLEELRATRPLSVVMAEHIAALRTWAQDRTVPAH
ncbi:MAG TPA: AAA family ATPase [Rhodothermales bacterium]|nr:AAA family ATPase [Rhodothermales bacterium]